MIDVGGTHVKMLATGMRMRREFDSGPMMTPRQMVSAAKKLTDDWEYDAVSIGYPGPVRHGRPSVEPWNLGRGWVGFDYRRAFRKPVRVLNDAAMQALGSYEGGHMLFIGLGTGMGSALVIGGQLQATEFAHMPFKHGKTFEDFVGLRGMQRLGHHRWHKAVHEVVEILIAALQVDYVVLGGGNARHVNPLPKHTRLGNNSHAFRGGFRIWEMKE
ncbi:MAG TPA: ROK family protein [Myxococcota bacterium]|nr:ROK family protein [Myxococcota bacterium]